MSGFKGFDQRHYETFSVNEGYAQWAELYNNKVMLGLDGELLESAWNYLYPLGPSKMVDLAAGTGRLGQFFKEKGIRSVTGIDLTPEMLGEAEKLNCYSELHVGDACNTGLDENQFDLATIGWACCHLEDLEKLYAEVQRLLEPGSHFLAVGYHPLFLYRGIPTHFSNTDGKNIAIKDYVHPFSEHFSLGQKQGWSLQKLEERFVDETLVKDRPNFEKHRGLPIAFSMLWKKPSLDS